MTGRAAPTPRPLAESLQMVLDAAEAAAAATAAHAEHAHLARRAARARRAIETGQAVTPADVAALDASPVPAD